MDTLAAARSIYFIEGTFSWLVYDLAVRFVRPRWATLLLGYICMEISFLLIFAMSFTSWHRWVPVTSVVVLLSVLPLLFIDRPWRMQSFVVLNAAGFLLYDIQMMTKPQKFIELDVINVVFYCVVEFICYYLLANIMMRGFLERCKNDAVRQGMIENLAYIIENRDENTGGHVQRTSRFIEGFVQQVVQDARIMALVDVYDALVSERVYKPAIPREKALAIIREGRGTQFDPNLTDIFLAYMEKGKC